MRKLTEAEVKELQGFKGKKCGREAFLDRLEEIYSEDESTLKEIEQCRDIYESLFWIESYPAHEKTVHMYYQYMDELLNKIGYHK